jgi:alkylation response protein AidB-like acyl-CoA dehydrogenase
LQRLYYDGGFAGICFPRTYGGQGLTYHHQMALNEEILGYEYPVEIQVPTLTPCAALLLEFGTEQQKRQHIPAMLSGEETWMQFLSEPSGGSDVAGALTSAVRDGDQWVLNGSKIWTSGAWWADWGLCLARTNWEVPKHRGLTVFMLPIHQPGIEIQRIEMLSGSREFCQEFLTDVVVPDSDRLGAVDEGWTVGIRWMYHERSYAGGSPYVTQPAGAASASRDVSAVSVMGLASGTDQLADPRVRELIGEIRSLELVEQELVRRVGVGIQSGAMSDQSASLVRLFHGTAAVRAATVAFEIAGTGAIAWGPDDESLGDVGVGFLMRQSACIAGGTTEMSRNVISERVLGMPRERTLDHGVPFRDVPRNATR